MLDKFLNRVENLVRIVKQGWGYDDIDTDTPNPVHVISNVWGRVVAVIQGWDSVGKKRRMISVDENGRVAVTFSPTGGITPNISVFSVSPTPLLIITANPHRSESIIKNNGVATVFLGKDDAVNSSIGYPLLSGETIIISRFTGNIYACTDYVTSEVRVIET